MRAQLLVAILIAAAACTAAARREAVGIAGAMADLAARVCADGDTVKICAQKCAAAEGAGGAGAK